MHLRRANGGGNPVERRCSLRREHLSCGFSSLQSSEEEVLEKSVIGVVGSYNA